MIKSVLAFSIAYRWIVVTVSVGRCVARGRMRCDTADRCV